MSLLNPTIHYFTHAKAETIAYANQRDDPDWTYQAIPANESQSIIRVADENGIFLGYL